MRQIDDILQDSQYSSEFFLTTRDIIGADDPAVLSILSGDRLICCFDPHDSEFELLGGITKHCQIPSLNAFDFVYTDPSCQTFRLDVVRAAETGCILIIQHADSVLSNPFLNSIASSSVTSGPFYEKLTNISPGFRVIFLIERPPRWLNPHMTFIHSGEIGLQRVSAVLINDDLAVVASTKRMTSEMMLHAQRENLYLALQHLTDQLSKIHSCDCEVLGDVLLQSQLFEMSVKSYEDSVVVDEHSLDGSPWVAKLAPQILQFLENLQDLYRVSPLYLWPFSKLRELIEELRESEDLMAELLKSVASTVLSTHRWRVDELKNVTPKKVEPKRLSIFHYEDLACATDFLLAIDNGRQIHYSIAHDSELASPEVRRHLAEGKDVVFSFFEENEAIANGIDKFLADFPMAEWNPEARMFIVTETAIEFPAHLICICRLFALE
jgi:hypothetical protein